MDITRFGMALRLLPALCGIAFLAGCQSYTLIDVSGMSEEEIAADVFAHFGVPGASAAIIENFAVKRVIHYGVKEQGTDRRVDDRTIFQAASISKPITAIGIMSLVQRGDLDVATTDVNRYLKRWHLDENGFGDVTIGNLLSHTGGTSVSGFPGYDIGKERPTLIEVLSGAHPANTPEVRVLEPPGRSPRYSGGGYTVLQLLIEDSQNAGFAEWYAGHVLSVVGTTGAFFGEPTSPDQIDSAALAHDEGGKRYATGPWHVYPELAAAGLWISAPDLASVVVFLQKTLAGDPPHAELLSSETAELMVSTHAQLDAFTRMLAGEESIGYGFFLIDRDKDGRAEYFSHGGSNWGYKALFMAHMEKGYGAVVLTNSENGYDACASLIEHIGRKHGWENF